MTELCAELEAVRAEVMVIRCMNRKIRAAKDEEEKRYFIQQCRMHTDQLVRARGKAFRMMDQRRMTPMMREFCMLYYVNALPMDECARMMDRSVRQCTRYKRRVEQEKDRGEKP